MTRTPDQVRGPAVATAAERKPIEHPAAGPSMVIAGLSRTIRRRELRTIVPLADTTIYELEQRGEFPRRFHLTPRCVVRDLSEVEAWLRQRRRDSQAGLFVRAPKPNIRQRKTQPVRG